MSSSAPLVTIGVPAYNAASTIRATLDSLLVQTCSDILVIVVDNASTDATPEIVNEYAAADRRVRLIRHPVNIGGEANFSFCLHLGEGKYTAIFHADDVYSRGMVEAEVAALERSPEAGAVFTMAEGIDESGATLRTYALPSDLRPGGDGLYRFPEILRAVLKYGNFFFCPAVMARTPVYRDTVVQWDGKTYGTSADLDVWLRIMSKFPVAIIDEPLLKYRLSPSSYSYRIARSRTERPDIFRVLDHYVKNSPPGLLSAADLRNYRLQQLRDGINRAFNLLLQGRRGEGLGLLSGLFCPADMVHALRSVFHIKLLLYGCAVLLLHFLPLNGALKDLLFRLRYGGPAQRV